MAAYLTEVSSEVLCSFYPLYGDLFFENFFFNDDYFFGEFSVLSLTEGESQEPTLGQLCDAALGEYMRRMLVLALFQAS